MAMTVKDGIKKSIYERLKNPPERNTNYRQQEPLKSKDRGAR